MTRMCWFVGLICVSCFFAAISSSLADPKCNGKGLEAPDPDFELRGLCGTRSECPTVEVEAEADATTACGKGETTVPQWLVFLSCVTIDPPSPDRYCGKVVEFKCTLTYQCKAISFIKDVPDPKTGFKKKKTFYRCTQGDPKVDSNGEQLFSKKLINGDASCVTDGGM